MSQTLLDRTMFEERLRLEGRLRYHDWHRFHQRMHAGLLSRHELGIWVENRYYYQSRLPIKDALIIAKSEDRVFRQRWATRLREQDGSPPSDSSLTPIAKGGLELWLDLAEGVGLDRGRVERLEGLLPDVKKACDRYVEFVAKASLLEAVAASLTECFAPELMERRMVAWEKYYPWVPREATGYFQARVRRARQDSEHGLEFVLDHAQTRAAQEACVAALIEKCSVLWAMLDAIDAACADGYPLERAG